MADQPVRSFHSPEYQLLVETLVEAREEAGMGQEELSKKLGQARMYIYKCETMRRRMDPVEMAEISRALSMPPGELLHRWIKRLK